MVILNAWGSKDRAGLAVSACFNAFVSVKREAEGYRLTRLDEFALENRDGVASGLRSGGGKAILNRNVISHITGRALFTKIIKLPKMSRKEAMETLAITQKESIPFGLGEAFYDVWILNGDDSSATMDVLLVAIKNEDITSHVDKLKGVSLRPRSLSIAPAAIAALMEASNTIDTTRTTLFIELAENVIGLHFFQNKRLIFTREIPFGIDKIIEPLINITLPEGAKIKDYLEAVAFIKNEGLPVEGEWNSDLLPLPIAQKLILPYMEQITKEIGRTIKYFSHNTTKAPVANAYLVGSGAIIKGMAGHIEKRISIPCAPYNPLDDFLLATPSVLSRKNKIGPLIAIPVGLAIDNGERVDLLRGKELGARASRFAISPASVAALFIFACLSLGAIWAAVSFAALNDQISGVTANIKTLEKSIEPNNYSGEQLVKINGEIAQLKRKVASYPAVYQAGYNWAGLFKEFAHITPDKIALTHLVIDFANKSPDQRHYGNATIEGDARGGNKERLIAISELIYNLKRSPFFRSARIKGTFGKKRSKGDDEIFQFRVKTFLNKGSSMMALSDGDKNG